MSPKEKGKFEDMAKQDKVRYEREMKNYVPPKGHKKKRFKDPNAPKRPPYVSNNDYKVWFWNTKSTSQHKIPDGLSPQVCLLPVLRWVPPQGEEWESRTHDWWHGQETGWDVEQQNCRGQAAIREEGRQAEGEVWQGNSALSIHRKKWSLSFFAPEKCPILYPQDIVAYRTKGKVDSESAATADDDEEEDEEEEEDDDDDEDDDE